MIGSLRSQPDARSIVEPKPPPRPLLFGDFEPLPAPDPLHPITPDLPAADLQQRRDPTIAVAAILGCKRDNRSGQSILVGTNVGVYRCVPARLADDPAGMAFRQTDTSLGCLRLPAGAGRA